MSTINNTDPADVRATELCARLSITRPGAVAVREPCGQFTVWASASDAQDDDGSMSISGSVGPITDTEWAEVAALAWVETATQL